jgi:hypothetical protein
MIMIRRRSLERRDMKSLFDPASLAQIQSRIGQLGAASKPQWGRMNVAQALAHCSGVLELALGDRRPGRMAIGRLIGRLVKPIVVGSEAPIRPNSPTLKELVVLDTRDVDVERRRLLALLDRFARGGPAGCTDHPHPFFGRMSADDWARFEYKHLDHHLRQFGA